MSHFWEDWVTGESLRVFFNHLPGVQVFVKDKDGRFIYTNDEALQAYGDMSRTDVLGKTDFDIFDHYLAETYVRSDRELFDTKEAQMNIVELVSNKHGKMVWVITNKMPLFNREGELLGLLGSCQEFAHAQKNIRPYLDIVKGVEYLDGNFPKKLDLNYCASLCNMSVRQFERKFKTNFYLSPQEYLMRTRIQHSCNLILKSKLAFAEIANQVGFYDQSAFIRQFKKIQGITPGQYRKKFS